VQGKGSGEGLARFKFQAGELVLADAAYCRPPGIAKLVEQEADLCVRLNRQSLPLLDEKDHAFPLRKKLKTLRKAAKRQNGGFGYRRASSVSPAAFAAFAKVRKPSSGPIADWCASTN